MRISDWSSDVCSSDLAIAPAHPHRHVAVGELQPQQPRLARLARRRDDRAAAIAHHRIAARQERARVERGEQPPHSFEQRPVAVPAPREQRRSEEHTSELQSLMRISYAVFCLKKKTTNSTTN